MMKKSTSAHCRISRPFPGKRQQPGLPINISTLPYKHTDTQTHAYNLSVSSRFFRLLFNGEN